MYLSPVIANGRVRARRAEIDTFMAIFDLVKRGMMNTRLLIVNVVV
jgi:hypothetical protein